LRSGVPNKNTVAGLKSNILAPQNFGLATALFATTYKCETAFSALTNTKKYT